MAVSKSAVHFILVRTRFASNLGSAVRAMKNMGFENLILVEPACEIGVEARALAMKGATVLDRATFFPSLEAAAHTLNLLVGATGRFESRPHKLTTCRVLAEQIVPRFLPGKIGIAFGPEDNGLGREELRLCHWWAQIPTGSDYPVMNLAQAVAVVAYELHMALEKNIPTPEFLHAAGPEEVQALLGHAEQLFQAVGFPRHISLPRLMQRMQKMAGRARLEKEDVNMLHGVLTAIEKALRAEKD